MPAEKFPAQLSGQLQCNKNLNFVLLSFSPKFLKPRIPPREPESWATAASGGSDLLTVFAVPKGTLCEAGLGISRVTSLLSLSPSASRGHCDPTDWVVLDALRQVKTSRGRGRGLTRGGAMVGAWLQRGGALGESVRGSVAEDLALGRSLIRGGA